MNKIGDKFSLNGDNKLLEELFKNNLNFPIKK